MKNLCITAAAFVLLPALAGLLPCLRLVTVQLDLHLVFIVFLALGNPGIGGAACAFAIGYLADLLTGLPMGLSLSTGMFTFVAARLLAPVAGEPSAPAFGIMTFVFAAAAGFFAMALGSASPLTSGRGAGSVILSALALAPVAALLFPPLSAIERRFKKKDRMELRLR